jgi:hypothetical protein
MKLTKQAQQVLDLIERDGHITRLTAMHYGIANVTARITELRDAGIMVNCFVAKDADGSRYGRWSCLPKSLMV